jgi:hypothetical protein
MEIGIPLELRKASTDNVWSLSHSNSFSQLIAHIRRHCEDADLFYGS